LDQPSIFLENSNRKSSFPVVRGITVETQCASLYI